jgi:hypothetical protein
MAAQVISKQVAQNVIVPLIPKVLDLFRKDEVILIEWTSPDHTSVSILWGVFKYEKGERKTFTIKGKPGFVQAVLKDLNKKGAYQVLTNAGTA